MTVPRRGIRPATATGGGAWTGTTVVVSRPQERTTPDELADRAVDR
ncbi:hypothetical protein [Micromonospora palomenae]|nr:hypothetical protein [Micromonospora palomenae]